MEQTREEQLKQLISDYNTYCSSNKEQFLANGINFNDKIRSISQFMKEKNTFEAGNITQEFFTDEFVWGFIFADLSNMDLSKVPPEHLARIPFSTSTKWPPKDKMPKGFDPEALISNAKQNRTAIPTELHRNGLTGKNVCVAYLDSPFDTEHVNYKDKKIEYIPIGKQDLHFHGYAVSDRLLSVAPDCNLIYFGCGEYEKYPNEPNSQVISKLNGLKQIIERVENGQEISAVGMSTTLDESIERIKDDKLREKASNTLNKYKDRLNELGVAYIDSPATMDRFNYAGKLDPFENNLESDNYVPYCQSNASQLPHILEADSVRPLPCTTDGYVYENNLGCASWVIPQVVGQYAIAKQIDRDITFDDFADLAKETATKNEQGLPVFNSQELVKELQYRKENETSLTADEN